MSAPLPRGGTVPVLLVVNLLPLWLVVEGLVETADLLMTYAVETLVLMVLAGPRVPGLVRAATREHGLRAGLGVVMLTVLVAGTVLRMTAAVAHEVSWDAGSVLSILAVGFSVTVGLVLSWRRHGSPVPGRGGPLGAFGWRFTLLVAGAGLGLGAARTWDRLVAHGWEPAPLGEAWAHPLGHRLVEAGVALDVPTAVLPALFVVLVRTVNEVLHEVYLICAAADAEDRRRAATGPGVPATA